MRRLMGLGARRSFDASVPGAQSLHFNGVDSAPGATSPTRLMDESMTNRAILETTEDHIHRVDQVTRAVEEPSESQRSGKVEWKGSLGGLSVQSSTDSFSSVSDSQTSSRTSSASANSASSSDTFHLSQRHPEASGRTIVIGFDANVRDALVLAIAWVFKNVVKKGDVIILIGVMDYIRGPLGYKVQVNDQTWLGANKKFVEEEIARRKMAWYSLPGLEELCKEKEVKVDVRIKPAARREVAIVQGAIACGAVHVVLDKSLNNRRRKFYFENLSSDVTRMRRSGGVDKIRSKVLPPSPTSVITAWPHDIRQQENSVELRDISHSGRPSNLSPSGRVTNVSDQNTCTEILDYIDPQFNDDDELFTIDHFLARHSVNLESEVRHFPADQAGYESDDLFSLCGDGPRRDSISMMPPSALYVRNWAGAGIFPPRSQLDSGPPLDKRLSSVLKTAANNSKKQNFVSASVTGLQSLDGLRDMVNVHLCDMLFPGESLLVGASPSSLFLINAQCAMRDDSGLLVPYSMTAGPPTAYIATEGGTTLKLSELKAGQCVMVLDTSERARSVPVGYTTTQPIKGVVRLETSGVGKDRDRVYSILVHCKQPVCFKNFSTKSDISVVDLKAGDAIAMCLRI